MERRSLLDGDMTPTRERGNVFDDAFEVDDFDGVADGFRPSDHDREGGEEEEVVDGQPIRTVSAHYASSPVSPIFASAGPSRNSTRKSRSHENPFASPEDGNERPASMSFEPDMAHRSVSSASSNNYARTDSPRFGAGPSHPYGMYPQGTMQRSSSIATQSTIRPPQRQSSASSRRGGPQHPYTLYPQGVSEDVDDEEDLPQDSVPIGFPGLGQSYHRRMGPDGEEQDIIGADGHTEQLPPYTRYPEDGPEKVPLLVPAAPTALHSRAPVAGTDPTMDLMHTALRPQPTPQPAQSMTDQSLLGGRNPSMSNVELMHSNTLSGSLASNRSWSEKSWKEKRKTKFCGIPLWWYLLSFGVLAFIAIVLGSVIGGFVEGVQKHKPKPFDVPSTSLYDASPIATPVSGSPATGTYALAFSTPQETQAACLTQQSQQAAWSCDIGGAPAAAISVGIPAGGNQSGAFIFYADDDQTVCYGTQASFMETTFVPFMTVQDNDDKDIGPAYYFQQYYDKVVVVPETALSASSSNKQKRQAIQLDQGWLQQKQAVQPGEKPWFCVWNNTFVEGFIYVDQPVVTSYSLSSATASATPSSANSSQASGSSPSPSSSSSPTTTQGPNGSPSDYITTTFTMPSTTGTFTGYPAALSAWSSHIAQQQDGDGDDDDDNGNGPNNKEKRQLLQEDNLYDTLQLYPYVVKIEERRLSNNAVQPYCQQYQILDNGGYNWVAGPNNEPIIIQLDEQDPGYGAYESAGLAGSSRKLKGRDRRSVPVAGGCHCQWMSGQQAAVA